MKFNLFNLSFATSVKNEKCLKYTHLNIESNELFLPRILQSLKKRDILKRLVYFWTKQNTQNEIILLQLSLVKIPSNQSKQNMSTYQIS